MTVRTLSRITWLTALLSALSGCEGDMARPGDGPFGAPAESRLLAPFAGAWIFDFEKTLDAQKAAGVKDEQIDTLRKLYSDNPQFGKMHPDVTITGNEAVCSGIPPAEYRFFAMHEHNGKVCGKAWHHEDRFDPGDMSKCYVRLALKDNNLSFEMRMKDGLPDLNDPDLRSSPPAESGSEAQCDANNPSGKDWSQWTMFVFVKQRQEASH